MDLFETPANDLLAYIGVLALVFGSCSAARCLLRKLCENQREALRRTENTLLDEELVQLVSPIK
jgi:hypothetical protein